MNPVKYLKIKKKEILSNSFHEANTIYIWEPDKNTARKETNTQTNKHKNRPIYHINIDAKFLNKILKNQIQQHIKAIICYNQEWFIPGMPVDSTLKNQLFEYIRLTGWMGKTHSFLSLHRKKIKMLSS